MSWQEVAGKRKARREEGKKHGTKAIQDAGIRFASLDNGWHLRIEHGGKVIDYMPGNGSWSIKGERSALTGQHYGVGTLIRHIASGSAS